MLEQEEFGTLLRKKAEVQQAPQRCFAEVVGVFVAILGEAYFGQDHV